MAKRARASRSLARSAPSTRGRSRESTTRSAARASGDGSSSRGTLRGLRARSSTCRRCDRRAAKEAPWRGWPDRDGAAVHPVVEHGLGLGASGEVHGACGAGEAAAAGHDHGGGDALAASDRDEARQGVVAVDDADVGAHGLLTAGVAVAGRALQADLDEAERRARLDEAGAEVLVGAVHPGAGAAAPGDAVAGRRQAEGADGGDASVGDHEVGGGRAVGQPGGGARHDGAVGGRGGAQRGGGGEGPGADASSGLLQGQDWPTSKSAQGADGRERSWRRARR